MLQLVCLRLQRVTDSPAVVGSAVPIAVVAVPLGVLAVHWVGGPWRLGASNTVLVLSLDVGESLQGDKRGAGRGGAFSG